MAFGLVALVAIAFLILASPITLSHAPVPEVMPTAPVTVAIAMLTNTPVPPSSTAYLPLVLKNYAHRSFIWQADFEGETEAESLAPFNGSGVDHWADGPNSYYEIVDDPTGSGRGKIYKGVVTGPPPVNEATDNGRRHRPYPDVYFTENFYGGFQQGPFATEFDVWMKTSQFIRSFQGREDTDPWLNFASLFNGDDPEASIITIPIGWHNDAYRLAVSAVYPAQDSIILGDISPVPFPQETWVRIRLEVGSDRVARLYQDGVLVSTVDYPPPDRLIGTNGGHWGLYAGRDVYDCVVLNDNIRIEVY